MKKMKDKIWVRFHKLDEKGFRNDCYTLIGLKEVIDIFSSDIFSIHLWVDPLNNLNDIVLKVSWTEQLLTNPQ